ncbi:MAG: glutamate 5-kinase [Patescibacteria group bacterium]
MKKSVVIKIGSNSLLDEQANIDTSFLQRIVHIIFELKKRQWAPLLVLSGAVAAGRADSKNLVSYASSAARGQMILTSLMNELGEKAGIKFAQFLLSNHDIIERDRYNSLYNTFDECLELGLVPLINENDATGIAQYHDFVDNDQVATIVGVVVGAEKIFLFTNVAGVFRNSPNKSSALSETPIASIRDVNKELMCLHLGKKSLAGRGGMEAKLRAARLASFVGITTYILDSRILENAVEIIDSKKCRGTVCLPWKGPISLTDRTRRLIVSHTSSASIRVDAGAEEALHKRKSLLAVGVTQVFGTFEKNDSVEIIGSKKQPVALGVSALSSVELAKIINSKKKPFNVEVAHADNLVLFPL